MKFQVASLLFSGLVIFLGTTKGQSYTTPCSQTVTTNCCGNAVNVSCSATDNCCVATMLGCSTGGLNIGTCAVCGAASTACSASAPCCNNGALFCPVGNPNHLCQSCSLTVGGPCVLNGVAQPDGCCTAATGLQCNTTTMLCY